MRLVLRLALVALTLLAGQGLEAQQASSWLSAPQRVADGVEYFTSTDQSLADPVGPTAVFLLKLDPSRVQLSSVHAKDEIMGLETVDGIANRHGAIAAINGGFFNTKNGEPVALLKEAGELVSDSPAVKGAVIIRSPPRGKTELEFDQAAVRVSMTIKPAGSGRDQTVAIDGVDTTRARGKLMLYTPSYHADSDTAPNGTEWAVSGKPLRVTAVRHDMGHTPIPRDGVVLSFGGLDLPETLTLLVPGARVEFKTEWKSANGLSPKRFDDADAIVNGAGLLRRKGLRVTNWEQVESLSPTNFINMRHPRTLVGVDRKGAIWFAVIDGRQPGYAVGMQFADLNRLCDRLDLTDALNLDGGGSSTMVVNGRIVNKPSDVTGPRPVSDAILAIVRK
jgi:hypothetical protein